ncbi:MAG: HopJ type III effector protein [Candidatus Pelagadaptatus aseana]|uniref:HopJ type III effector protein n=1 Tax=Candidatus Pelagadaptatus aseana TaxID=3120508 RepID=UPI0039B333D6
MNLEGLLNQVKTSPQSIEFADVMAVIDAVYDFEPTGFTNGDTRNEAGENNGSCKIFGFARLQNLSEPQTLALFGDYYRSDVLKHLNGSDHQNIRNFMKQGWEGVLFDANPLTEKEA